MTETIATHGARCGIGALYAALEVPTATYYRAQYRPAAGTDLVLAPRVAPTRALPPVERQQVLDVRHAPRFVDLAPAYVYATLLDKGTYHRSERSMYRVLAAKTQVRERQAQRHHSHYAGPAWAEVAHDRAESAIELGYYDAQRPDNRVMGIISLSFSTCSAPHVRKRRSGNPINSASQTY